MLPIECFRHKKYQKAFMLAVDIGAADLFMVIIMMTMIDDNR